MTLHRLIFPLLMLSVLGLSGCFKTQTAYRYNQPFDYSSLKTYSWQTTSQQTDENSTSEPAFIQQAVNSLLSKKGYKLSPEADFYISYHYTMKMKQKNIFSMIGIGIGSFGRYCGIESSGWYKNNEKGHLVIELIDAKQGHTFWEGRSTGKYIPDTLKHSVADKQRYLQAMVEDILNDFPSA